VAHLFEKARESKGTAKEKEDQLTVSFWHDIEPDLPNYVLYYY